MKLKSYHVTNFKNVDDSNVIEVDPAITCFVGKNEAGKTALLQALYRLNPINPETFDEVKEYPRKRLRAYQRDVEAGREKSATVISAKFSLDADDVSAVEAEFGRCISAGECLSISIQYNGIKLIGLNVDEAVWAKHYLAGIKLSETSSPKVKSIKTLDALIAALSECAEDAAATACITWRKN